MKQAFPTLSRSYRALSSTTRAKMECFLSSIGARLRIFPKSSRRWRSTTEMTSGGQIRMPIHCLTSMTTLLEFSNKRATTRCQTRTFKTCTRGCRKERHSQTPTLRVRRCKTLKTCLRFKKNRRQIRLTTYSKKCSCKRRSLPRTDSTWRIALTHTGLITSMNSLTSSRKTRGSASCKS